MLVNNKQVKKFYNGVRDTPVTSLIKGLAIYRNEKNSLGRKVAFGTGAVTLGLLQVIDTTASIGLAIIASPFELAGVKLSRNLVKRTYYGSLIALVTNTASQYKNIFNKTL